jgi:hypothetical protein
MTISIGRNPATAAGEDFPARPPARAIRVDVPLALLHDKTLSPADIGAGVLLLALTRHRGVPTPDDLAERGVDRSHLDHLLAAGLGLGGAL